MSLRDRINYPDRRQLPAPIADERRVEPDRRSPWVKRASAGALFGVDQDGRPIAKDMTGAAA